jgi:regulator of RNase E activity RraB
MIKKQAKRLKKQARTGDIDALNRVNYHLVEEDHISADQVQHIDCMNAVARELGFDSYQDAQKKINDEPMILKCCFMFDRHAFAGVKGDQEQVTKTLIELHESDGWHGIHGKWHGYPDLPTCQCSPRNTPDENKRLITDSVAAAFEHANGRAAVQ